MYNLLGAHKVSGTVLMLIQKNAVILSFKGWTKKPLLLYAFHSMKKPWGQRGSGDLSKAISKRQWRSKSFGPSVS